MDSGQINNSLFKLLVMEMVPATIESSKAQNLTNEQINVKLEMLGYKLGLKLNELTLFKMVDQYNNTDEPLHSLLDVMKFICKDFWKILFKKQISNLRTNHRGTFVLVDSNFRLIEHFDLSQPTAQTTMVNHLLFVNGIIKGTLKSFGINSIVTNEIVFPQVTFNIETDDNN